MEDFRRRKRSVNEHDPQTISRSKSMRLDDDNLPVSLLLENLYIYDETQPQHDCRSIIEERKRKRPDDYFYVKGPLKIPRNENLPQRVQERSFMQQHKPAGGYNNKDKGKGKGKAKAKGKEKCTKRQRNDDQVHSETKISRVYHSDPPLSESHYIWKLRDMSSLRQNGRHFLIYNKKVALDMYHFIRSTANCASDSHMIAFISILNCMCRPTSSSKANHDVIKDELHQVLNYKLDVFNTECYPFWGGLAALIRKLPSKMFQADPFHFLTEVINIMSTLLDMDDNILQFLPLDDLQGTVKQLNDSETRYTSLLEQSNKLLLRRDSLREKEHNPSDQFKNPAYVILPTSSELQCGTLPDHFEIYKGHEKSFSSNQEYLQMHYDLLCEDFIHPLRKAFHKIQDDSDDCKDLKIYENVHLVGKDVFRGNLSLKFKFCLPGRRRTNWEHNKRLIYGSLVCLSQDNFTTTIIFATVPERNVDELREGVATLTILEDVNTGSHATPIYPDEIYTMIESPGFLEAYAPVVSRLKTMMKNPEDLPLEEYLVHGSTEMYPPSYLEDNVLDLSGVLCKCSHNVCVHMHKEMNVCDESSWSSLPENDFDESQLQALKLALTSKLALIQGPPGTGKTYIGINLVKAFLHNKKIWNPNKAAPLLVMCYTNHALDQFLEGILSLKLPNLKTPNVLRVGGRSKNEAIQMLNVYNKVRKQQGYSRLNQWAKRRLPLVQAQLDALKELCYGDYYNPLNELLYCSFLHPDKIRMYDNLRQIAMKSYSFEETFAIKNVLEFFEIDVNEIDENTMDNEGVYRYSVVEEDARKIDDFGNSSNGGAKVYRMVKTKRKIKHLFERVMDLHHVPHVKENLTLRQQKTELLKSFLIYLYNQLQETLDELEEEKVQSDEKEDEITVRALQEADIVGFTTTGASKYNRIIKKLRSKIIIIEEAGEVMEGHIIAALTKHTQHLILIGDHKQLRPKANDYTIGKVYGLEISLFERLINNNLSSVQLQYQHRMRPEISKLICPHIYQELLDHETVLYYESIRGIKSNLFFIDHNESESDVEDLKSPKNEHEALMITAITHYLLKQNYDPGDITVLTPYTGQVVCIKKSFNSSNIRGIRIMPIDHFQGEENEIILLSLVRTMRSGFVKEENRICVALSRAKKGFYCIGNFSFLQRESSLWKQIVSSLKERGLVGNSLTLYCSEHDVETEVSCIKHFAKVRHGGCSSKCEFRLDCGHMCDRQCHPDKSIHKSPCQKECRKPCENNHPCPLRCSQCCRPCLVVVPKVIPKCGHIQEVPCSTKAADFMCTEKRTIHLKCGHKVLGVCGKEYTELYCSVLVEKKLPCDHYAKLECSCPPEKYYCKIDCNAELKCGHICKGTCGRCNQGRLHIPCTEKCTRVLLCGHPCSSRNCANDCPPCKEQCPAGCVHGKCGHECKNPCIKCAEPCKWNCRHYKCNKRCGDICDRPRCNEPCKRKLKCEHPCLGLCGESCPQLCRECNPNDEAFEIFFGEEDEPQSKFIKLADCGHIFEVNGFDKYMDTKEEEHSKIQWKTCPKCTKLITQSLRYANTLKKIKEQMKRIKQKEAQKLEPFQRNKMISEAKEWNEFLRKRDQMKVQEALNSKLLDITLQRTHTLLCGEYDCKRIMDMCLPSTEETALLKEQIRKFQNFLNSPMCTRLECLPEQVFYDIHNERRRLLLVSQLCQMSKDMNERNIHISLLQSSLDLEEALELLHPANGAVTIQVSEEVYAFHINELNTIRERFGLNKPTKEEIKTIVAALGSKKGSWYVCPNGHYYNIGECGGANQIGRCIECKAEVGGTNHRLLQNNRHSSIDGSQHSAWSEQANMANYQFNL